MISRLKTNAGFTLIELLLAIAIFGLLSTLMYGGIAAIVRDRDIVLERLEYLDQVQRTVRLLNNDFGQLQPREVRGVLGRDKEPALMSDPADNFTVRLSRIGWRNPLDARPRGILQRAQYRLADNVLYREYWPVMDPVLGDKPREQPLLTGVLNFEVEYLDEANEWQPFWPPRDAANQALFSLPAAVRYRLEIETIGEIRRLVEVVQ
jgi:general secretion pathway protein J